ncbi:response regulator [Methylobacterium sp. E-041]|uniref:response regulator n=1 Tax=unclassified Methylobacterium TaxID=2615210 RepID=UPI001FBB486A|nr:MULTISPECIES: response regulator [unclassified Methylobacterium]MCJ2107345.1 response regulator [Methylobacterium sp. E-041]MCJ2109642.1 response regulator [Methylobacterium sp. E-025]
MVVEDDARMCSCSVGALRELGYSVVHAANGTEAVRMIEAGQVVALLFTDIVMPEMTGRQLADAAMARLPNLKVLYTTGYVRRWRSSDADARRLRDPDETSSHCDTYGCCERTAQLVRRPQRSPQNCEISTLYVSGTPT